MYRNQQASWQSRGVPQRSLGCGDAQAEQHHHIDQRAAKDGRIGSNEGHTKQRKALAERSENDGERKMLSVRVGRQCNLYAEDGLLAYASINFERKGRP